MADETGILTPDQVERIRARDRKRKQREREKNATVSAQAATPEEFWKLNRSVAKQDHIAELLERQEAVKDMVHHISCVMDGSYSDPTSPFYADPSDESVFISLNEAVADIAADVAQHGQCQMELVWLEFWKKPDVYDMLLENANKLMELSGQSWKVTFLKFGLVTAFPSHRYHEWMTWLAAQQPTKPQPSNYTTVQCGCGARPDAVPVSIVDGYREKNIPYRCHACITAGRSGNHAVGKALAKEYGQEQSTIFDSWGRVKL